MTRTRNSRPWLQGFRLLIAVGAVVNLLFAVPALFAPRLLERVGDLGRTDTLHWPRTAGVLLLILTAMYVPVVRAPLRHLPIAWLLVVGRFLAGAVLLFGLLFLSYPPGMRVLAAHDLALSTVQAVLLWRALRER